MSDFLIIKMSNAYSFQDFSYLNNYDVIDFRDMSGTKCYLDEENEYIISSKLANYGDSKVHFIDSGNYHYLSYLFLKQIDVDFNLILFDHHPDDQAPGFGDILSCGGWVLKSRENIEHLKNVFTYGTGDEPNRIPNDLPIYISIDKDYLSTEESITDWDQGDASLSQLLELLDALKNHQILGIDICGDDSTNPENSWEINGQTNQKLICKIRDIFL